LDWRKIMNSITANALSGLQAARQRLDVASNNIANAASVGALPAASGSGVAAFTPQRVNQQSVESGGVATSITPVSPAIVTAYQPHSSSADAAGLVAAPKVDLTSEIINQKAAFQAYAASARLVSAAGQLDRALLGGTATTPHHATHHTTHR
jgi:flagellar basal-body rod protein FlgC